MSTTQRPGAAREPVTIQAKSIEQALVKAAGALGVTQDEMAWSVVKEDTAKGLLGFFRSPSVEIKAWVKGGPVGGQGNGQPAQGRRRPESREQRGGRGNREDGRPTREERQSNGGGGGGRGRQDDAQRAASPERSRPKPSRRFDDEDEDEMSSTPKEPLAPEQVDALVNELKDFCAGICGAIAGEPVTVTGAVEDGRLVLNVESEYVAQQIAKNSKLAEAMEHILRKKPRHLRQELPFRIFVDVGGLRKKRESDLVQMAHDLSAKVHENKRPIVLNYKSSYDRKIIHMALDKDERVYTKSIGSGPNRKLMILPSRDAASGPAEQIDAE
jgi:spoIIIJ-associated protein